MDDENELTSLELYNLDTKVQIIRKVQSLQIDRNMTVRQACDEVGISFRTFYDWLARGIYDQYLLAAANERLAVVGAMALDAMPAIAENMVQIATGEKTSRGTSAVSAARWLADVAVRAGPRSDAGARQTYRPESVSIRVEDGAPVILDGKIVVED
jgi:uncharacterized protein with GYD domain